MATDACLTAYHAVHGTGKVTPDETVLLFGLGGLGFNALQILLRDVGVKEVIVADRRVEVLDEAVRFGVKRENVVPVDADVVEFVGSRGLTVDVVMDFVGVEQTFGAGLKIGMFFCCPSPSPRLPLSLSISRTLPLPPPPSLPLPFPSAPPPPLQTWPCF